MTKQMMKAAIVEADGSLVVRDIPVPAFGEYQALVKLSYGSTCAGTDQRIMEGKHPNPIHFPSVLGHESIGRVINTGAKVTFFHEGDLISRVGTLPCPELNIGVCWGGFAQYGVATDWQAMEQEKIPSAQWEKCRVQQVIPSDIDEKIGPMFITWRETLSYVNRMGIQAGDRVLIIGSGANALAFVSHCAHVGANVVVLGNDGRKETAFKNGALANIDYKSGNIAEQLQGFFPDGIDHIIDAIGSNNSLNTALPFLCKNGQIGVYGWHERSTYGIQPFAASGSFRVYCNGYDESETHDEIISRIRKGALSADNWYDTENPVPLKEIALSYKALLERKALKYLIDLS